ncbi:exosortase A [Magnetospirillum molischianum]|uniref:Methanolan biosynthesis EpsI domain-containing protein n=1 Tax=Magnetospirillum molischianum DSM 120 TaxID=1150626 RepID=H8FQA8_MAGML|nr:exosortase A [Magnetospirillum molischianum]CCG40546.1 membrane hypothetical protein [Magnetospirillum molischianum DSM 120]
MVFSVLLYWDGYRGAVRLWEGSAAYTHCFLIIPIALFLVWTNRDDLRGYALRPSAWGAVVVGLFGGVWFFAYLSGVAEGVHIALVGMMQGVLLGLLGPRLCRRVLLPLLYLWLMVPTGDFLIGPLQTITVQAASLMLEWSGVSTFHEGLTIEVPSGLYTVAPGCAGLNFLLAGLATALAFAELAYRRWTRKLAFVAAMIVVAVVGNALRVFLIILIAPVITWKVDIVDDHLLYGWGFFSFLLLAVMTVGFMFREEILPRRQDGVTEEQPVKWTVAGPVVAGLAVALVLPAAIARAGWPDVPVPVSGPAPGLTCGEFAPVAASAEWGAGFSGIDTYAAAGCEIAGRHVDLAAVVLRQPVRHGKIIGMERRAMDPERWGRVARTHASVRLEGVMVPVQADVLFSGGRSLLVWSLFHVDGAWREPGLSTALADLRAEVLGHPRRAAMLVAATEFSEGQEAEAAQTLAILLGARSGAAAMIQEASEARP